MGDSAIQWTDSTWNPTTGCDRVSPGCANCYALSLAARWKAAGQPAYQADGDPRTSGPGFALTLHPERLDLPLHWRRPRRIFVDSMSDLFHAEVPDDFLDRVFAVMAAARQHTFQVLTKRPERMREYLADPFRESRIVAALFQTLDKSYWPDGSEGPRWRWPRPNIWLGTSVENARWRTRVDELRATPAAVRFLSCEPLLGPLGDGDVGGIDLAGVDWVIVGGESGPGARFMDEDWVRDIVANAREQGVAPFVKQLGAVWSRDHLGRGGHAGDIEEWPEDLRVREFPAVPA